MKVVALAKAKNELSAYVEEAQRGRVLVTRHGRPAALIIGVEGEEFEDLMTRSDPEFWRMIVARRSTSKTIPASEMRKRLGLAKRRRPRRKQSPRR
jgi:prevent-host-death family protein